MQPNADGINRVNYEAFRAQGQDTLLAYISKLEAVDPTRLTRPGQFALLANLYNAKTIAIVLDRYPVKSIRDIALGGGFTAAFIGGCRETCGR